MMRMLAALVASLIFTLTYATLAAKSRRTEMVLIPILDVLQSVPVLGYLSFTVVFFVSLFPGNALGPELAAIFAVFTSQAWNMAFSFYQSLRTIPTDLDEASRSFRFSGWQRFWRLEVPFAMPGLIWNMMMSMSGGWFFVVASEAISVGDLQIALPGIGSYVARAIQDRDLVAIGWAIAAMTVAIVLYDQLLFRPLVAWADKFRVEQTAAQVAPRSWVIDMFRQATLLRRVGEGIGVAIETFQRARLALPLGAPALRMRPLPSSAVDIFWYALVVAALAYSFWMLLRFVGPGLSWADVTVVVKDGILTLLRVAVLIGLATLIWVPIGVAVGLQPALTEKVQPIAQFLAAFPANLLFPVAVFLIVRFDLTPNIWLSPLMILGTQWYILFNVIAGAMAIPTDLKEVAMIFRFSSVDRWRRLILPGVFPYLVTGLVTASGGAWNASIVAEYFRFKGQTYSTLGVGSTISQATDAGNFDLLLAGTIAMAAAVVTTNRLVWRRLYRLAETRYKLEA